jgi:hypothetical protein
MLGNRHCNTGDIHFLEGVRSNLYRWDLSGEQNERDRIHIRVCNARNQIGSPWAGSRNTHTYAAGNPGVSIGSVHSPLFVPHEHVLNFGRMIQGVVNRKDCPARIAEHNFHVLSFEALNQGLGNRHFHENTSGKFCKWPYLRSAVLIAFQFPRRGAPAQGYEFASPKHGYLSRANEFLDPIWAKGFFECVYFALIPGTFESHGLPAQVNDTSPEYPGDVHDLNALARLGRNLDHDQFPVDIFVFRYITDLDNIYKLVELLGNLLYQGFVSLYYDGHPGDIISVGATHRKTVDIEAAACK